MGRSSTSIFDTITFKHSGVIDIKQVPSTNNLANLFMKPLSRDYHHRLLATLNITQGLLRLWGSVEINRAGLLSKLLTC
jgi:hypothetical protein